MWVQVRHSSYFWCPGTKASVSTVLTYLLYWTCFIQKKKSLYKITFENKWHEQIIQLFKKKQNMVQVDSSYCNVVLFHFPMKGTTGGGINIKMSSYQYRKSHCGDKTILRPSYLHNGISYTDKMTSLYWIRDLDVKLDVVSLCDLQSIYTMLGRDNTGHWVD